MSSAFAHRDLREALAGRHAVAAPAPPKSPRPASKAAKARSRARSP
jgi:hypothetical protein